MGVRHKAARPDPLEQIFLAHYPVPLLHQEQQDMKAFGPSSFLAAEKHTSPGRVDLDVERSVDHLATGKVVDSRGRHTRQLERS